MKRKFVYILISIFLVLNKTTMVGAADLESSKIPVSVNKAEVTSNSKEIKKAIKKEKIVNPYKVYSYEQMIMDSEKLCKMYNDILKKESIGKSVEGWDIIVLKLGNGPRKLMFNGSTHAREYITTTFLMKMLDEYCFSFYNGGRYGNYNVKALLENVTLYIVPMVNPDGVNLVQNGIRSVKNQKAVKQIKMIYPSYLSWKSNIRGVDLNMNYPMGWEEKKARIKVPSSQDFKGYSSASEPEIKTMMELCLNNSFVLVSNFHTQGELILWDDYMMKDLRKTAGDIASGLSKLTGYAKGKLDTKRAHGSTFSDWFRWNTGRPALTIELFPHINNTGYPVKKFDDAWKKCKYVGLFLMNEAIKLKGFDYKVYKNGVLVQEFKSYKQALEFLKKYKASRIVLENKVIY